MQITKKNHYLPVTYLKHFLNPDDSLFVYQKGEKFFRSKFKANDRILQINGVHGLEKNIGFKNKLYHPDILENKNVIEDFFTTEIDTHFDYLLDLVRNRRVKNIDFEQGLRFLISTAMVRTPDFKLKTEEAATLLQKNLLGKMINNDSLFKAWLANYEKENGKTLNDEMISKIKNCYNEERYNLKWGNNLFLGLAFISIKEYGELFSRFNLSILVANPKNYFITSDAPVVYFVPKENINFYNNPKSIVSRYTEIYFPLSKEYCVLMSHENRIPKYIQLDRNNTRRVVNYNVAYNSRDFIISPYRASFLDKFVESYIPYPFELKTL